MEKTKLLKCKLCSTKFTDGEQFNYHIYQEGEFEDAIEYAIGEIYVDDFPGNCGIKVMSQFPEDNFLDGGNWGSEEIPNAKERLYNRCLKGIEILLKSYNRISGIMYATTNKNQKIMERILKKLKFKEQHRAYNKNHYRSVIKVWVRNLNPVRKR